MGGGALCVSAGAARRGWFRTYHVALALGREDVALVDEAVQLLCVGVELLLVALTIRACDVSTAAHRHAAVSVPTLDKPRPCKATGAQWRQGVRLRCHTPRS